MLDNEQGDGSDSESQASRPSHKCSKAKSPSVSPEPVNQAPEVPTDIEEVPTDIDEELPLDLDEDERELAADMQAASDIEPESEAESKYSTYVLNLLLNNL
jgi:hypothetical protein